MDDPSVLPAFIIATIFYFVGYLTLVIKNRGNKDD